MFDKIFGMEAVLFMIHLSDGLEDADKVFEFKERFVNKMNYTNTMILAKNWSNMTEIGQAKVAIRYMGDNDASRFMMYMDYLSKKIEKGDFK